MPETKRYTVGLGVCGGIAAYKAIEVLRELQRAGCEVRVAMTKHATEFIQPLTFRSLSHSYVFVDDYAADNPDPIAHINFSQSIDLLLVPATANTIAKFAHGIADDFLSTTYLASTAPVLIAPAMNTMMWEHAATQRNISILRGDGVAFVEPITGELACLTVGTGKLDDVQNIVHQALKLLNKPKRDAFGSKKKLETRTSLSGEHILITAGATREEIDPVRYISNYSSGKMGFAIAEAAKTRGAKVTVIAGSTSASIPEGVKIIRANSGAAMHEAVLSQLSSATVFIGAAAVADYRPTKRLASKLKKTNSHISLELEKTADILADVAKRKVAGLTVVGFAAETDDVLKHAREKLEKKNLDLIVANDVSNENIGFGTDENKGAVIRRDQSRAVEIPLMSKLEMAERILDEIFLYRKSNGKSTKR